MDWTTILTTVLSGVFGLTTVYGLIRYPKAAKREREAEAKQKEAEARIKDVERRDAEWQHYDKRFDALHEDIDLLNKQLTEAYRDKARVEEINLDKTRLIRELNEQMLHKESQIGRLKLVIQWLQVWRCRRIKGDVEINPEACDRRLPDHPFPMEYDPPAEVREELTNTALIQVSDENMK